MIQLSSRIINTCKSFWPRKHMARGHVGTQGTWAQGHVDTQGTRACKARGHVGTQGTRTRRASRARDLADSV